MNAKAKISGFSLVELLMVIGLMGGLGLVMMELTKQTSKSSAKFQFDTDVMQTTNEIIGILSSPDSCLSTLNLKNAVADSTIDKIVKKNLGPPITLSNQFYKSSHASAPSKGYGNAGVKIDSYALSATSAEVNTDKYTTLLINFQNKNILGGAATIQKKIRVNVSVNGSNQITACNAVASGSSGSQWVTVGSDIYYAGGYVGVETTSPTSTFEVAGSFATQLKTITATTTLADDDHIIAANATTANITVTLPTAVGIKGRQYTIKRIDSSSNSVTVATTSSETIDANTTFSISQQYQFLSVVSDGSKWIVIGTNASSSGEGIDWL